ncbi:MAG: hypothetical protein RL380_947, partial [Verrucomicrobiota bacterium]
MMHLCVITSEFTISCFEIKTAARHFAFK